APGVRPLGLRAVAEAVQEGDLLGVQALGEDDVAVRFEEGAGAVDLRGGIEHLGGAFGDAAKSLLRALGIARDVRLSLESNWHDAHPSTARSPYCEASLGFRTRRARSASGRGRGRRPTTDRTWRGSGGRRRSAGARAAPGSRAGR